MADIWKDRPEWAKNFYNSTAWRKCRDGFAQSKNYTCERCLNRNVNLDFKPYIKQFHVHHKIKLTEENVNDPVVALNWDNLELLCQKCHDMEHYSPSPMRGDIYFDENGQPHTRGQQ